MSASQQEVDTRRPGKCWVEVFLLKFLEQNLSGFKLPQRMINLCILYLILEFKDLPVVMLVL